MGSNELMQGMTHRTSHTMSLVKSVCARNDQSLSKQLTFNFSVKLYIFESGPVASWSSDPLQLPTTPMVGCRYNCTVETELSRYNDCDDHLMTCVCGQLSDIAIREILADSLDSNSVGGAREMCR